MTPAKPYIAKIVGADKKERHILFAQLEDESLREIKAQIETFFEAKIVDVYTPSEFAEDRYYEVITI